MLTAAELSTIYRHAAGLGNDPHHLDASSSAVFVDGREIETGTSAMLLQVAPGDAVVRLQGIEAGKAEAFGDAERGR